MVGTIGMATCNSKKINRLIMFIRQGLMQQSAPILPAIISLQTKSSHYHIKLIQLLKQENQ